MSLGDFIGSLQFYPWKERMIMPEEESTERVGVEIPPKSVSQTSPSVAKSDGVKERRVPRQTSRQSKRRRRRG